VGLPLGYAQINAIWRNWYISAARELEGLGFDPILIQRALLAPSRLPISSLPLSARAFVEGFTARLKAEDTLAVLMTVGFRLPDVCEAYGIEIRRGVAQFDEHLPEKTDLTLTLDKAALDRTRLGQLTMRDAILGGVVQVSNGPPTEVARFFEYFEMPLARRSSSSCGKPRIMHSRYRDHRRLRSG
jgi:alkyl sulfatase BDS1-like metallo-beta-lactamase superfamily hydrolase